MDVIKKEDVIDSSNTILKFMNLYNGDSEEHELIRKALFEDLYGKLSEVNEIKRLLLLNPGLKLILPKNIREMFKNEKIENFNMAFLSNKLKEHKNIGIVTALKKELDGVLFALNLPKDSPPVMDSKVFRYWFSEIDRENQSSLSVVVSMTGEPRNVPAAIAVEHLLNHFTVDLMIFIGIAAGPKDKVKVGDVVVSDRVLDYEHVRGELIMEKIIENPRPLYLEISGRIKNDLSTFDVKTMHYQFIELKNRLPEKDFPEEIDIGNFLPSFHRGTLIAGERLFADGKINEFRKSIDERIRACDQEDSGFAQACKIHDIDWCVFRGISDYGDPQKKKDMHFLSSISAASAAVAFLKNFYRLPNKDDF